MANYKMTQAEEEKEKELKIKDLSNFLLSRNKNLAEVAPKIITAERLIKVALSAISKNEKLMGCSMHSLYESIHTAAQLGFEAGSPLGYCHLVPYAGVCTLQLGFQGLVELARRSGRVKNVKAVIVRPADDYDSERGLNPNLYHKQRPQEKETPMIRVYAVAEMTDGTKEFEEMERWEVDKIRNNSQAYKKDKFSPWQTHYDEMAKKTVIKRLCKSLPMSPELAKAIEVDNEEYKPVIKEADVKSVRDKDNLADKLSDAPPLAKEDSEPKQSGKSLPNSRDKLRGVTAKTDADIASAVNDLSKCDLNMEDIKKILNRPECGDATSLAQVSLDVLINLINEHRETEAP